MSYPHGRGEKPQQATNQAVFRLSINRLRIFSRVYARENGGFPLCHARVHKSARTRPELSTVSAHFVYEGLDRVNPGVR